MKHEKIIILKIITKTPITSDTLEKVQERVASEAYKICSIGGENPDVTALIASEKEAKK